MLAVLSGSINATAQTVTREETVRSVRKMLERLPLLRRLRFRRVSHRSPKWSTKLAAYDVYIWDQCFTMEQSLRID
jgi:hypothetical protein